MVQLLSLKQSDTTIWDEILGEAICISHSANNFEKDMNPTIFSPAKAKT